MLKQIFLLLFTLPTAMLPAQLRSSLEFYDISSGNRYVVHVADQHFEAPNWSKDGESIIFNSQGRLYRLILKSNQINIIDTDFANRINNDHGISPDGKNIVISHGLTEDWKSSSLFILPFEGGIPKPVKTGIPSFWHGWSPNGDNLAYVGLQKGEFDIYSTNIETSQTVQLTNTPGLDDGPDYSPDGKYIYFNSFRTGNMEIWRMEKNGQNQIRITNDKYSNWFPHPSPDGKYLLFLSYLEDQGEAHPPMKNVALRLLDLKTNEISTLCEFIGGQGTINVPSWSPDGKKFAFVSYKER